MFKGLCFILAALLFTGLCAGAGPIALPVYAVAMPSQKDQVQANTWMLHLPGISGRRWVDDQLTCGLRDAGFAGALEIYDWTGEDPGLGSLVAYRRNQLEAQKVADYITDRLRKHPGTRMILSGHSGG